MVGVELGRPDGRPIWWHIFADACSALEGESRQTSERLVAHVNAGWEQVARLQIDCDRLRATYGGALDEKRLTHLLEFVDTDVVAPFVDCARETAGFHVGSADPRDWLAAVTSESTRFERGVSLCALASASAFVPHPLKSAMEHVAYALIDWSADFDALVTVLARASAGRENP